MQASTCIRKSVYMIFDKPKYRKHLNLIVSGGKMKNYILKAQITYSAIAMVSAIVLTCVMA